MKSKSIMNEIKHTQKTDWISVEDNLPVKNGKYLVTCDNWMYSPYVCVYSTEYGSQYWNIPAGRVTHWMELPVQPNCKQKKVKI